MPEVVVSVDVDADPQRAWDALVDWDGQRQWMLGTTVAPVEGRGTGVGDRLVARTALGPLGFSDPMRIEQWQPPHRCQVRHLGRVVRGVGVFEVVPLPDGRSRVVWAEFLELPLGRLGQLGFLLVRPAAAAGLGRSLQRFARWLTTTG